MTRDRPPGSPLGDVDELRALLRPLSGRFWRMHLPMWASEPLSGEGARRHGGRWNAQGMTALYLSATHGTAIAEALQALVQPGTLVPYDVEAAHIIDLTDAAVAQAAGLTPAVVTADWRRLLLIERRRPPTWDVVDRLLAAGAEGALVRSAVGPDPNLVLWRWGESGAEVKVLDPDNVLPRGLASWRQLSDTTST